LQDALGRRVAWDATLNQVARVLPPDMWLTELDAQSPTPTTISATSGATSSSASSTSTTTTSTTTTTDSTPPPVPAAASAIFSLSGYAFTNEGVAQVLARLALVPTLTNVTLVSTASMAIGTKQVVQFQVSAAIVEAAS
jgi:Tfp pilus assembly protein PilN